MNDDNDGQMKFRDLGGLKFPGICLTGEENYTASVSSSCRQAGADLASSGEWHGVATANDAQHPHTALASTCERLAVATQCTCRLTRFFEQIYILVSFEAIHCVKLISCK